MKVFKNIKDKTGKDWKEWLTILDNDKAISMSHATLAKHINTKYNIDAWWAQAVAIGYEHERGLRQKYEKCDGAFEVSKSKTFNVELSKLFELIYNLINNSFFGKAEITTSNKDKNIRAKLDKTSFSFDFYPKENSKTQIVIQHFKLEDSNHCEMLKEFWQNKLKEIEKII